MRASDRRVASVPVFIRAPVCKRAGSKATVLAKLSDQEIVALRQGHLLATAFHPELSDDERWHRMFIDMVENHAASKRSQGESDGVRGGKASQEAST